MPRCFACGGPHTLMAHVRQLPDDRRMAYVCDAGHESAFRGLPVIACPERIGARMSCSRPAHVTEVAMA